MLLLQEQDRSLEFLKIRFKGPAAASTGGLQLRQGSGFALAESVQESGQDTVGTGAETAQCREGTAAVPDAPGSWGKHRAGTLMSSAHVELPDRIQISPTIRAQQVQGVQGALNVFSMCCVYSLRVTGASLRDLGMLSACCRLLSESAHELQSPSHLFLETLGRNPAIDKTFGEGQQESDKKLFYCQFSKNPGGNDNKGEAWAV